MLSRICSYICAAEERAPSALREDVAGDEKLLTAKPPPSISRSADPDEEVVVEMVDDGGDPEVRAVPQGARLTRYV